MTPKSLQDPRAEKAAAEPLGALWAEYERLDAAHQAACDTYGEAEGKYFASKPSGLTDKEDKKARAKAGVTALDKAQSRASNRADAVLEKIANARVTSLEGVLIKLRAVAAWNKDEPSDPVIEGVRTAIEAVERLSQPAGGDPDDPFPALEAEWVAAYDAYNAKGRAAVGGGADMDRQLDELGKPLHDSRENLINTPTRSIAGVVAKLRMMVNYFDGELGAPIPVDLMRTALAGAEHIMRGPGVVTEGWAATGRDPLVALWAEWTAEWESDLPEGIDPLVRSDEEDRFTKASCDRIEAIEVRIMAEPPKTLAGSYVQTAIILNWLESGMSTDRDGKFARLREKITHDLGVMADGGGGTPPAADPLVALYAKWHALEWRRVPEGLTDDEAEAFNAQSADLADAVATEIVSASPDTLVGLFAQMAVLRYWAENAVPERAEAAVGRLCGRIEAALQDAAGQATTS